MMYIHSNDKIIDEFIENTILDRSSIKTVCDELLIWFDKNVEYSRLDAPFFPLQRSDLDVIAMRSGTCGDYSNLIVSVLQKLGYEAMYAYVRKDCYGDAQDHICAAVRDAEKWILIDATQPYRKWHGFNCHHQEYELLSPNDFEARMKKEEAYWTNVAKKYGNDRYAGILYAPWIHNETIRETQTTRESVFFLLLLDKQKNTTLYAYYMKYSKSAGSIPIMGILSEETPKYCFSYRMPADIWDNDQWGEAYFEEDIPIEFRTEELYNFINCISKVTPEISKIRFELKD